MGCPDCLTGGFLPGEPTGSIGALGAYFSPAPADSTEPKHAICLLTDGFGLDLKNCKILADNLAKALKCDVWVPDYFTTPSLPGRPLIPLDFFFLMPNRAGVNITIFGWLRMRLTTRLGLPALIFNRPRVVDKRLSKVKLLSGEKHPN